MSYSNPLYQTYTLSAATISTAATLLTIIGPRGLQGRLESIGGVVTTATTGAATAIEVGISTDTDKYGTLSIPVASVGAAYNNATISTNTETQNASTLMPADTAVQIRTDGSSTAGAATITVTVAWF